MTYSNFTLTDHIGLAIVVHKWIPDSGSPKAMIYVGHGMAEHALRYAFFAEALNNAGYVVYADDHRGHGKTMEEGKAGVLYKDGWIGVVKDIKHVTDQMKKDYPNLPLFLFGHSWGSFLIQEYMQLFPNEVNGIILSGTAGHQDMLGILIIIGKIVTKLKGKESEAGLIYKLGIEPLNKPYIAEGSPNAWISSIKEEVAKYDADPLCGFKPTNGYFMEMGLAFKRIWNKNAESRINVDTPVLIINGSDDMVSQRCKNLYPLINRYQELGIKDLSYKIYEDARHEVLNDKCRNKAVTDCISWLDSHMN
ncbi:MAG: lysophospholipase [Candidatus Lokiarchaeota archaeon]|nr:lysophospholipase [Candidatus Lokiarchaeota archaeon]